MDKVQIYYLTYLVIFYLAMSGKVIYEVAERKSIEALGTFGGIVIGLILSLPIIGRIFLWW